MLLHTVKKQNKMNVAELEYLVVYGRASMAALCPPPEKFTKIFRGCYSTKPLTNPNFVKICFKMPEISTRKNLCSPKK